MALSHRLEIRQGQGLVITPQLQQAIKLLQLSSFELDAYVEGELERNPLLQRDDREGEAEPEAESKRAEEPGETALDRISDAAANADMDARQDELYADASPGERASGESGDAAPADGFQTVSVAELGR